MFPYRDDNPTLETPIVTIALIAANVAVWALVQGFGADPALTKSICELGLIPGEFLGTVAAGTTVPVSNVAACVLGPPGHWWTPLTSMFLHGGWLHIIFNMWFLWVFGNNVEDSMGRVRFLAFYLLCGLAAALAQVAAQPGSALPMVGASGAIGGVMGAYIVLYPRVRVHMLIFLFIFVTRIVVPAYFMLGFWFLGQLASGLLNDGQGGGTAFWAHIGGFVAGAVLINLFKDQGRVDEHRRAILAAQP
jgi:membrane associated rhomboid family serine protease